VLCGPLINKGFELLNSVVTLQSPGLADSIQGKKTGDVLHLFPPSGPEKMYRGRPIDIKFCTTFLRDFLIFPGRIKFTAGGQSLNYVLNCFSSVACLLDICLPILPTFFNFILPGRIQCTAVGQINILRFALLPSVARFHDFCIRSAS
jgi:hypothetical protein